MRYASLMFALLLGSPLAMDCARAQVPADCPVTRPPDPPFVPPQRHPPWERHRFWLGTNALWTSLDENGIWSGIAARTGVRNKFWWWREGWTPQADWEAGVPGLIVTAHRLDGEAPAVRVGPATNGKLDTGWAMLVMLELPTEGCWEVTGTYLSESLSMVVYVPRFESKK
jgi:hypothetical protein